MTPDELARKIERVLSPVAPDRLPLDVVDRAIRQEVDHLCTEACLIEDPIESEVNFRLRATLLRIADTIKESA